MPQADLFSEVPLRPEGFRYREDLISPEAEQALAAYDAKVEDTKAAIDAAVEGKSAAIRGYCPCSNRTCNAIAE